MCSHTRLDKIENREIRSRTKAIEVHRKVQEKRLRWCGNVLWRKDNRATWRALGKEVEGKRRRGKPCRRWMECVKEDLAEKGLVVQDAADRQRWRTMTKKRRPYLKREKPRKEEDPIRASAESWQPLPQIWFLSYG